MYKFLAAMVLAAIAPYAHAADAPAATAELPKLASPWEAAFARFAAEDAAHPVAPGGVLFVGSSSIRLWSDLEDQFALPVIVRRGFGGSQLSDCVKNLSRLVLHYRPRTVLVYAGDNDLAAGVAPRDVLKRFVAFVDGVHRELPDAKVAYISIKPSPARIRLLAQVRETNDLIRDYADGEGKVEFIDVFTPMLDESGAPRRELFRADALHLNATGYALWRRVIGPYVH